MKFKRSPSRKWKFPNDSAKLIADCPTIPGQSAELRLFISSNLSMVFREEVTAEQDGGKSYDGLTGEDYAQYFAEVRKAVRSEPQTWVGQKCFDVTPREGARNVFDIRWVGKWKKLKHSTDPNKMVWGHENENDSKRIQRY